MEVLFERAAGLDIGKAPVTVCIRRCNKWLASMLVEAAGSVARMHGRDHLAVQHARLTRRRGMSRAQTAVAHSILTATYYVLETQRALPRPRTRLARQTQRSCPHPSARGPAREARPHRNHRPRRLTHQPTRQVGLRPTRSRASALLQRNHGSVRTFGSICRCFNWS